MKNLEHLAAAIALPNRRPTHPEVAKRAERWLASIPAQRRLPAMTALSRVDELLDAEAYRRVATPLSRRAQQLVLEILYRIGVHPLDLSSRNAEQAVNAQ